MIKEARVEDVEEIMHLIEQAIVDLKNKGIDQWQNGYPNKKRIEEDILSHKSYVLVTSKIQGYMFVDDYEPTYDQIDGKWINDKPYKVIHRFVIDMNQRGQGLAAQLLNHVISIARDEHKDIRVDTHFDNQAMRAFLKKHQFVDCGVITLGDLSLRKAYQKVISLD